MVHEELAPEQVWRRGLLFSGFQRPNPKNRFLNLLSVKKKQQIQTLGKEESLAER
jgi:hypothetical protein